LVVRLQKEAQTYRRQIGGHKAYNTQMKKDLAEFIRSHTSEDEIDKVLKPVDLIGE
jgi:hypothetical protein